MKTFFLLLFSIMGSTAFAQLETRVKWFPVAASSASDTIYYNPSQKLVWKDFKGRADNNSEAIAVTFSGFGYAMRFESKGSKTVLDITVYCFFNRKQSWSKTAMQSDYALLHEQHHFDITGLAGAGHKHQIGRHLLLARFQSGKQVEQIWNDLLWLHNRQAGPR